jgi:hypothetical protein
MKDILLQTLHSIKQKSHEKEGKDRNTDVIKLEYEIKAKMTECE